MLEWRGRGREREGASESDWGLWVDLELNTPENPYEAWTIGSFS